MLKRGPPALPRDSLSWGFSAGPVTTAPLFTGVWSSPEPEEDGVCAIVVRDALINYSFCNSFSQSVASFLSLSHTNKYTHKHAEV